VELKPEILLDGLGKEFLITQCGYKAFPTEALTHQPISAVLTVMQKNNLAAEDLAEIHIQTTTRGADILSDPSKYDPQTKETADHSLPYCIAVAAADGGVWPTSFEEDKLFDPRIRVLLKKIKVVSNTEIDDLFPGVKRAIATLTTNDGKVFSEIVDHAKGSPKNPMTDDDLVAKFRANAHGVVSKTRQDEIIDATWKFDTIEDMSEYMKLLVRDA
jgi:2-methylcitrate dehydratase